MTAPALRLRFHFDKNILAEGIRPRHPRAGRKTKR